MTSHIKSLLLTFSLITLVGGFILIGSSSSWGAAFGVLFMIWGNNAAESTKRGR